MTDQNLQTINDYLKECIQHSSHCAHCKYNHNNIICFFAYDCFKNNQRYYNDEEEENNVE